MLWPTGGPKISLGFLLKEKPSFRWDHATPCLRLIVGLKRHPAIGIAAAHAHAGGQLLH